MEGEAEVWEAVPVGVRPALDVPSYTQQGLRPFKEEWMAGAGGEKSKRASERGGGEQKNGGTEKERDLPKRSLALIIKLKSLRMRF